MSQVDIVKASILTARNLGSLTIMTFRDFNTDCLKLQEVLHHPLRPCLLHPALSPLHRQGQQHLLQAEGAAVVPLALHSSSSLPWALAWSLRIYGTSEEQRDWTCLRW